MAKNTIAMASHCISLTLCSNAKILSKIVNILRTVEIKG